jgi:hypothetical protein
LLYSTVPPPYVTNITTQILHNASPYRSAHHFTLTLLYFSLPCRYWTTHYTANLNYTLTKLYATKLYPYKTLFRRYISDSTTLYLHKQYLLDLTLHLHNFNRQNNTITLPFLTSLYLCLTKPFNTRRHFTITLRHITKPHLTLPLLKFARRNDSIERFTITLRINTLLIHRAIILYISSPIQDSTKLYLTSTELAATHHTFEVLISTSPSIDKTIHQVA